MIEHRPSIVERPLRQRATDKQALALKHALEGVWHGLPRPLLPIEMIRVFRFPTTGQEREHDRAASIIMCACALTRKIREQ